jgi:hypothetical protein
MFYDHSIAKYLISLTLPGRMKILPGELLLEIVRNYFQHYDEVQYKKQ